MKARESARPSRRCSRRAASVERGGSVVVAPRQLPGRGELAVIADPDGARFGVLRADGGDPPDHRGRVNEWLWIELWTPEPSRAVDFYRHLFGYSVSAAGDVNGDGFADLIVGAPSDWTNPDAAYVIYGGNFTHSATVGSGTFVGDENANILIGGADDNVVCGLF